MMKVTPELVTMAVTANYRAVVRLLPRIDSADDTLPVVDGYVEHPSMRALLETKYDQIIGAVDETLSAYKHNTEANLSLEDVLLLTEWGT
jgi:hypothetical protein